MTVRLKHLVAAVVLTSGALAPSLCAQTARIGMEATAEIKKADLKIQSLCARLKKKMKPAEAVEFDRTQRAWLAFRDSERKFYENNIYRLNASQNFPLFVVQDLTGARVKQLEELLEAWNG